MKKENNESSTRLIPVTDWPNYHPYPSVAGLRHLIFHSQYNGFTRCIRRVGRRVLVHEGEFFAWVNQVNGLKSEKETNQES